MSAVVLATFGSLGSIHPYLGVARALQSRGHDVALASHECYRSRIEGHGLRFHRIRPDRSEITRDTQANAESNHLKKRSQFAVENLLRYVDQTYEDLLSACTGADLFVSHPAAFCGPLVAEKLGIRWLSVALAPATLFSSNDPPILPSAPWLAKLPRIGSFPHAWLFRIFKTLTRKWMRPLDALRQRAGLPPATQHPFFDGMFSPFGTLGWFSPLLTAPQADWPPRTVLTGFPFFRDESHELDRNLEAFLDEGPPPVVFTLGSNVVRDAGSFYHESLQAAMLTGLRAVLLTGDEPRNRPHRIPSQVFMADYAPYSKVFPRAAAVVHQGGIGTLGEAMAAGVPMLIVPHIHDQHDNAFRAARLGIARTEARDRYSAETAASHLRAICNSAEYKVRAASVKTAISAEDGITGACDAIEAALRPRRENIIEMAART